MTSKRNAIGSRPLANRQAEAWVRQSNRAALAKGTVYSARLTLDVTPALRGRIKVAAFNQGCTVAEMLRELLENRFQEHG
ncbi:chromosome partitioning protein ParB [Pseudomonas sp. 9Ag]|uniref:ribbon-helix-helix protein n=1 Tax=Pseudomonas sp. 9Ag TaxID=2653167 RepID=UPI0012F3FF0D|nr:chromosome partitioning protein ParB [Pseudomonas sp. 9Ag]VXC48561.1 Chromosome partitioning protein ParB [Pseudomonas sp. 9Ag]